MLIPEIYGEYAFKGAFEGTKFGSGKHREFSAAPTVDPTVAPVHLNRRHVRDVAPVSKDNKRCTSQRARITIVELVHRRSFALRFSC